MNDAARTPWHFWVVGIVSLLWNAFGANDYVQSQMRNREYLGSMSESMGVTADQMIAHIDSFPVYMHALWALGVWGAVAGSILLLLRSRYSFWAFVASLAGLAGSTIYQLATPQPEWTTSEAGMVMNALIWAIAIGLAYYAKRMIAAGVLR